MSLAVHLYLWRPSAHRHHHNTSNGGHTHSRGVRAPADGPHGAQPPVCCAIPPCKDDLELIKHIKTTHKLKYLCTVDLMFDPIVENAFKGSIKHKKKNPSSSPIPTLVVAWRTTQLERREEGVGGLPRFSGSNRSVSSVLRFAPNFVSSFYT